MKRYKVLVFAGLLGLLVAVAGCVPGIRGTSSSSPLDIDFTDPATVVEVEAGQTYFITNTHAYAPLEYFGFTHEQANDLLKLTASRVGASTTKNVSRDFSVGEVMSPEGWEVTLNRVNARREIVDEDKPNNVYYFEDNVQLFFSLRVPEGAQGLNLVRITIEGQNDSWDQIVLRVRVADPES